jgi:drug/metabolite transporter superfamily protein YnfA
MYAVYFHLGTLLILFFAAMAGLILIRIDSKMARYDATTLRTYSKFKVNLDNIKTNLNDNTTYNWLNSDISTTNCQDLRLFDWPTVIYTNSTKLPNNPACVVQYNWVDGLNSVSGNIGIQSVTLPEPYLCVDGVYFIQLQKYNPASTLTTFAANALNLTIKNGAARFSHQNVVLGTGFVARKEAWDTCVAKRGILAWMLKNETDCSYENSQFCSCVYLFVNRINDTMFVWPTKDQRTSSLTDILYNGISQCQTMRRARDIWSSTGIWHQQSQMLFVVAATILANVIYHVLAYQTTSSLSSNYQNTFQAVNLFMIVLIMFLSGIPGTGQSGYAFAEMLLCGGIFLILAAYYEYVVNYSSPKAYDQIYKPTIHPFTFGVVLFCITSFVLVDRGLINYDILFLETVKIGAMTLLYIKTIVFYDSANETKLNKILTHRSQLMIVLVLIVMSLDILVTPYGDRVCFSFVWLMPFAWVMISLSEMVWIKYFNIGYNDTLELVDIRRNLIFTLTHVVAFWVCAQIFVSYFRFADTVNKYNWPSPLSFSFRVNNDYLLPGFIRETEL